MSEVPSVTERPGIAHELTAFQLNVLTILSDEALYGLAIKRELETYYDDEVNHGRLYPNLDELVEMGLVEKGQLDKRTNEYALTDRGRMALLEQLGWMFDSYASTDEQAEELQQLLENSD